VIVGVRQKQIVQCQRWFVAVERRTLDNQIGAQDTHGGNTDASLGGAVRGAEAGEDDGGCATHRSEEGLFCGRDIVSFPFSCRGGACVCVCCE